MDPSIDEEISFKKLEIFLAFMDTRNLGRTAERLSTTTTSVHRALHSLESGLRCALFRLEGRTLHPNEAADAFAEVARQVLRNMRDGIRRTRDVAGYRGHKLRVGSLYSLTGQAVPKLVLAMKGRIPDLQVELTLGSNVELLKKLAMGDLDAVLVGASSESEGLITEHLFDDEIHFAARSDSAYARASQVDLAACRDTPFVTLSEGFVTFRGFQEAFRIAGFTPNIVLRTSDIFSLMSLVSGGVGCTLLPGRMRHVLPHGVRLLPLQDRFRMRQSIVLQFQQIRERDPNLLALLAACRMNKSEFD